MKKFLLVIATVIITFGAYAQVDSTERKWNQSDKKEYSDTENQHHADGFLFKNGKMLAVKDGKISRVEEDATLTNGTVIMGNGNYTKKGGTKMMFKEGEHMDMSGRITQTIDSSNLDRHEKPKKYDEVHQRPDSTEGKPE